MDQRRPPSYSAIAERFRFYADLCGEFAASSEICEAHRTDLLERAARWRRDAARVEQDGEMIASSRALLATVDAALTWRAPASTTPSRLHPPVCGR